MKTWPVISLTLTILAGGAVAPAEGQTLADAARREAERRSKLTGTVKVYTTADFEMASVVVPRGVPVVLSAPDAAATTPADMAAAAASSAVPAETPKPLKISEKRDEQHWRERAKVIQDRLNRLRADESALEQRVAALQEELKSASGGKATALQGDLSQANKDRARFRAELLLIEDEWTKFEERARKANVPPSWIR